MSCWLEPCSTILQPIRGEHRGQATNHSSPALVHDEDPVHAVEVGQVVGDQHPRPPRQQPRVADQLVEQTPAHVGVHRAAMWYYLVQLTRGNASTTRVSNEPSRRFHNHGEGLYWVILLVESAFKQVSHLRQY